MKRETVLSLLKKHKTELAKRYGVTKLGIFGSVARNDALERSDVDVVVEMKVPDIYNGGFKNQPGVNLKHQG